MSHLRAAKKPLQDGFLSAKLAHGQSWFYSFHGPIWLGFPIFRLAGRGMCERGLLGFILAFITS